MRRRFVKRIYIPLPDNESRRQLLIMLLSDCKHDVDGKAMEELVTRTEGFSGMNRVCFFNWLYVCLLLRSCTVCSRGVIVAYKSYQVYATPLYPLFSTFFFISPISPRCGHPVSVPGSFHGPGARSSHAITGQFIFH